MLKQNLLFLLTVTLILFQTAQSQECPENIHKIKSLPYWTESTLPCMYSGFIEVNKTLGHNFFYWFFKNTSLTNAPLVLWLGPDSGSSSMFGLFLQSGPIRVTKANLDDEDSYKVGFSTDGSWNEVADIVYLD